MYVEHLLLRKKDFLRKIAVQKEIRYSFSAESNIL